MKRSALFSVCFYHISKLPIYFLQFERNNSHRLGYGILVLGNPEQKTGRDVTVVLHC